MSAVGSTETYQARVVKSPDFIAMAAFDAGLVSFDDPVKGVAGGLTWTSGEQAGQPATLEAIEAGHGASLRANMGIRHIAGVRELAPRAVTDIAAALPHDLETVGLRRLSGTHYDDIRGSGLRDMYGLFQDDPLLAPSLQSQLFVYGALGALAGLPTPLSSLVENPFSFRVVSATAFGGMDSLGQWLRPDAPLPEGGFPKDTFAVRLAQSLGSHGPRIPAFEGCRLHARAAVADDGRRRLRVEPDRPMRRGPAAPVRLPRLPEAEDGPADGGRRCPAASLRHPGSLRRWRADDR
jgi:hypothetical protein